MTERSKGSPPIAVESPLFSGPFASRGGAAVDFGNQSSDHWWRVLVCLLLTLAVWVVFGQTLHHEFINLFINFDDDNYVYENSAVSQGITLNGFVWAFTQLNEAIDHYGQVLQLKPNYTDAHTNLGIALATQGKLKEAAQHFEQALQLKPDHADAHFNLGLALASQGQMSDAIQHFQQALKLASAQANPALEEVIRSRLKSYKSTLPQLQTP